MGSVPDVYTTGDNDPQIEPESYFRHYLYCDACGSFDLRTWTEVPKIPGQEGQRKWLGIIAAGSLIVAATAGWSALFPQLSLTFLVVLILGIPLGRMAQYLIGPQRREAFGTLRAAAKWALPTVVLVGLTDLLREGVPTWLPIAAGLVGGVLALAVREGLVPDIETRGMRCEACGATYANGSAFFTDLGANPRGLVVSDVPRPLGRSPFRIGASVPKNAIKP